MATLLVGAAFGALNGLLVTRAAVPPFVVTLGTLGIATGLGYLLNNGQEISNIPASVTTMGNTNLGGWIPVPVAVTAVITIWYGLVLARTRFGAYTLSIGDSREAVVRAGINDRRHLFKVYLLAGLLAGVAGILVMARLGAGSPDSGATDNLNAIAAVVIGGASLFGGRGTVIGTVIGTGIIAVLLTGLVLVNVPPFWQEVLVGAVLILAVYIDQLRGRRRSRPSPASHRAIGSCPDTWRKHAATDRAGRWPMGASGPCRRACPGPGRLQQLGRRHLLQQPGTQAFHHRLRARRDRGVLL